MDDVLTRVLIGQADPEIVAVEGELRGAQLDSDVGTLDRLLSENLLFTGPNGQLSTKAQDLAAHASGLIRFRDYTPVELRIRRVGADVAITALCAELAVEVAGAAIHGLFRYTRIWARERELTWRVVGGHVAVVPTAAVTSSSQ